MPIMLKIASWNLNQSKPASLKADQQLEYIKKQNADVWILTESHESLKTGPNYHLAAQSYHRLDIPHGFRWVSIWTRLPIISCLVTSDLERTAAALLRLDGGGELLVSGSVLPWLGSPWKNIPAMDSQAFLASLADQEKDICRLSAEHPDAFVCYGGDFYQDLNEKHYYGSKLAKDALGAAINNLGLSCWTCAANDPVFETTEGAHSNVDHICLAA